MNSAAIVSSLFVYLYQLDRYVVRFLNMQTQKIQKKHGMQTVGDQFSIFNKTVEMGLPATSIEGHLKNNRRKGLHYDVHH
jgi:hypothetical protein